MLYSLLYSLLTTTTCRPHGDTVHDYVDNPAHHKESLDYMSEMTDHSMGYDLRRRSLRGNAN